MPGAGRRGGTPRPAYFRPTVTFQAWANCPVPRFPLMLSEDAHGACPTGGTENDAELPRPRLATAVPRRPEEEQAAAVGASDPTLKSRPVTRLTETDSQTV